jgi:hypothetical protein
MFEANIILTDIIMFFHRPSMEWVTYVHLFNLTLSLLMSYVWSFL